MWQAISDILTCMSLLFYRFNKQIDDFNVFCGLYHTFVYTKLMRLEFFLQISDKLLENKWNFLKNQILLIILQPFH